MLIDPVSPIPALISGLECSEEAWSMGASPPQGAAAWCQVQLATGRWLRHGPALEWHTNGQLAVESNYHNGTLHGAFHAWYPDGTSSTGGQYDQSVKTGLWRSFYADGTHSEQGHYVQGLRQGLWIERAPTGDRTEAWYVGDQRDGVWQSFDAFDVPLKQRVYREGRMVNQQEL